MHWAIKLEQVGKGDFLQKMEKMMMLVLFCSVIGRVYGSNDAMIAGEKSPCSVADLRALESFRMHIVEDKSEVFKSWSGKTCCAGWEGVECDPVTGRVIKLELQSHSKENLSMYMRGTLSPALGNLEYLEILTVSGFREIKGPIPASVGNLRRLRQLYLENNKLSGPIPDAIGKLTLLETLSLNGNRLTGPVPESIGKLQSLIQLNLAQNFLTGSAPASLKFLYRLQYLDLNTNSLSGSIPELPYGISFLDLSINSFTGSIPESLSKLSSLSTLSLSQNKLNGTIPTSIGKLSKLGTLSLSRNQLSGSIPDFIAYMPALWSFNVSGNLITDPIPTALGKSTSLLSLDLSYNKLKLSRIPDWISTKSMTDIHLAGCGITGRLSDWKPKSTEMFTSIDLSDNALTGPIGDTFRNMPRLEKIRLKNNMLSSNLSETYFPELIGTVDLSGNRLFGTMKNILFDLSGACSSPGGCLEYLDLSGNLITGSIPDLDGERKLKYLDMSGNMLSGSVPASISMLSAVSFLDLSSNRLGGQLPASMGRLSELRWLDLANNGFTGKLPAEMTSLGKLQHVNLRNNHLCGHIPQFRPFSVFPASAFMHNDCLCGSPLPSCKV